MFRSPKTPVTRKVLAALLCVSLAGCGEKIASTAAPLVPPVPPGPTPEQSAKFKYEMDAKCASDTRAWFKANYPEEPEPIKVQGGGAIQRTQPTYQNHYSHKFNGCFAVLDSMMSFPPPRAQVLRTNEIYDVNENRKVGVLVQKDLQAVTACNVEGNTCTTKAEFETMARDYLVE
jgi:hypothetical protein